MYPLLHSVWFWLYLSSLSSETFVSLDTGAQLSYTTGSNDARALVFPRRNWWADLLICARKYYAVRV